MKYAQALGAILLASTLTACGGSSSQSPGDSATGGESGGDVSTSGSDSQGSSTSGTPEALTLPSTNPVEVTALDFGNTGLLLMGFADGNVARMNVMKRDGASFGAAKEAKQPVIAVAGDGSLAVLKTNPTRVVNMKGDLILNVNQVSNLVSAVFAPNDFTLYISAPDGTIRIWGQAHSFEEPSPTEKMEDYLNRQGSDFNIRFKPLAGPLFATATGFLVIADTEGVVSLWNPRKPSKSKRIMKLDSAAQSIATSGDNIVTTSVNGTLKVGKLDPPSYLPWSRGEKAAYVAASDNLFDQFIQLDEGKLSSRNHESGEVTWSKELPSGKPCGLKMSPDGELVAACIGNFVAVVYTDSGKLDSIAYRDSSGFTWTNPDGAKIPTK